MLDLFHIIYFTPFYFKNGDPPLPKFFIPIGKDGEDLIFAYLPTSKDFVPDSILNHGCANHHERNISCYIFFKKKVVTKCGFSFNKNTFIYFTNILRLSSIKLKDIYPNLNVDYEITGELTTDEKRDLINCLLNSRNIKQKLKRQLKSYKNKLPKT